MLWWTKAMSLDSAVQSLVACCIWYQTMRYFQLSLAVNLGKNGRCSNKEYGKWKLCSPNYTCVLRKSVLTVWSVLVDVIDRDMLLFSFKKQSIASAGCSWNMPSEILVLEIELFIVFLCIMDKIFSKIFCDPIVFQWFVCT